MSEQIQAFPFEVRDSEGYPHSYQLGMTLRDYFAAQAMQGWLASFSPQDEHPAILGKEHHIAELSYAIAEAMLEYREEHFSE